MEKQEGIFVGDSDSICNTSSLCLGVVCVCCFLFVCGFFFFPLYCCDYTLETISIQSLPIY